MMHQIYRGFDIRNEESIELPVKVYDTKSGEKVFACNTEDEALQFVDRTKRELAAAKGGAK